MKIREIITTTVLILAIIAVSTTTAAALSCSDGDICVNQSGWRRDGGAFNASTTPIQAAVDDANTDETICVAAGNYFENVDITTPHLTLRGEGAGVVTVTAADPNDRVFKVTADYANISGFTVTGATETSGTGFYLANADNCNISDNNASNNYYSIDLSLSCNNTLANNIASNNFVGIALYSSSNNTFTSNNASSNNAYGIYLCSSSNNTFTSNNASSNGENGIHLFYSSNYNTLANNTANSNNNAYGIHLYSSCNNNTLTDNTASNNNYGIHLSFSSNNTLANNAASNNNDGIRLWVANNNTLANNAASNNNDGIHIHYSCDNDVTCNLVQNNIDCGIYLTSGSTGNNITWNNIIENGKLQTDGSYHYQFKNSQSDGVDAINNFWGAGMNNDTIDSSIYEMGSAVKFYPFETEPVPCAPAPISEESPAFTTVDAVIALRIAVGSRPLDLRYDVSGDERVTSLDALMIAMGTRT